MREFVVLLAIVGATVAVALSQAGSAIMDGGREQPCQEKQREAVFTRGLSPSGSSSGMNLRYDGRRVVDGVQKQPDGGVSNEADQRNGKLCQDAKNEPHASVDNDNKNFNPQFALVGSNDSTNDQSNDTWIDQSQNAKAVQANVLWQGISAKHPPAGWWGGGGPGRGDGRVRRNGKPGPKAKKAAHARGDKNKRNS